MQLFIQLKSNGAAQMGQYMKRKVQNIHYR